MTTPPVVISTIGRDLSSLLSPQLSTHCSGLCTHIFSFSPRRPTAITMRSLSAFGMTAGVIRDDLPPLSSRPSGEISLLFISFPQLSTRCSGLCTHIFSFSPRRPTAITMRSLPAFGMTEGGWFGRDLSSLLSPNSALIAQHSEPISTQIPLPDQIPQQFGQAFCMQIIAIKYGLSGRLPYLFML